LGVQEQWSVHEKMPGIVAGLEYKLVMVFAPQQRLSTDCEMHEHAHKATFLIVWAL